MSQEQNIANLKLAQLFLGNNPYQEPILDRIIDREISENLDPDTKKMIKNIGLEDFQKKAKIYQELNMCLVELHLLNMKLLTLSEEDYKTIPIKEEIDKRTDFIQEQLEALNVFGIFTPEQIGALLDEFQTDKLKNSRKISESEIDFENLMLFSSENKAEFLKGIINTSALTTAKAFSELLEDSQLSLFYEISSKLDLDDQASRKKLEKELESGEITQQEYESQLNDDEVSLFKMFKKIFSKTVGSSIKLAKGTA